jgi:uncharacterized protein (TIGR03437 family)
MRILFLCLLPSFSNQLIHAQSCGNVQLQLTPDYSFAIGSSSAGGAYTFTQGTQTLAQGSMTQLALLHFDNSVVSTSGIAPAQSGGASFVPGKFGSAALVAAGNALSYPPAGNLSLADGTVEMWVSPQFDGTNSAYTAPPTEPKVLQYYGGGSGTSQLLLAVANHGGGPYFYAGAAGVYAGYPQASGITEWKAGEWHHLAVTYSSSHGRLRLYIDGNLAQETDAAIQFPVVGSNPFTIGGDSSGNASNFAVDEVRISNDEMSAAAIAFDAARSTPFANDEELVSLAGVSPGQLAYSVSGCGSTTYNFTGVPISNLTPPSGLLPPGSAGFALAFDTIQPTMCRYSVGNALSYASMQPLDSGSATATHSGMVNGLSIDPRVLNQVYLRCASNSDYLQTLTYRRVAAPAQPYPRIGNIWLGQYIYFNAPENAQKTKLFLGPDLSPAQAIQLRSSNPGALIIPSVNATDSGGEGNPPDSYYLKDTHGNKIADWCAVNVEYLLNVTKPAVPQFLAQLAYQKTSQGNFAFDGIFFDSFGTAIPQPYTDCYGNVVQIDSDGDGVADNPASLNAAWSAGEYAMVKAFRSLAPNAYVSGHVLESPTQPQSLAGFNGTSIEFYTQSVRDGQAAFGALWDLYQAWENQAVGPTMTMVQACPPNQLSYGYGYQPLNALLPSTIAFAQGFYPNMRFGLGLTLMGNGYFGFDFGDEAPPVTWWYDEYDFNLGFPIAPATQPGSGQAANQLVNSGFENGLSGWSLGVFNDGQGHATAVADQTVAADGKSSAHIAIVSPGTVNWHIGFEQDNLPLTAGVEYRVQFWARADTPRTITVFSQGGAPNFTNYGLSAAISIGTSWSLYSASFTAAETANDGRLEFWVGDVAGNVWLDDVSLNVAPPDVYRRDYTNGIVLLNGAATPQTVTLEPGFSRFKGTQAPLYQYIVDDGDSGFSDTGSWNVVTYNTGAYSGAGSSAKLPAAPQNQKGPFYHCWEGGCHELDSGSGQAQWDLNLPADGQYTIQAWLPAAPGATGWTKSAIYEVVAGGNVVATATIDQSTASLGDAMHMVAAASLRAADKPFVRVHNGGSGALIADAVYVTSAAFYNDGSPAPQVTLGAFDSILLQRQQPVSTPASQVNSVVNAASYQPAIASGGFVSIVGTGFASSSRSWAPSDFVGGSLPVSLDGVSVMIDGKPAYVEYISPTQVNAIAPDDDAIGQVQVQVTTPQGASYAGTVLKQKLAPGFFTYQSGTNSYVAAVHADGTLVGPAGPSSRPAVPGEIIEMYGAGFGATNPAIPTSQLISQPAPVALPATVSIGGIAAQVQWAGLVSPGLYQLNVQIPSTPNGDQLVQANISGFQTVSNLFVSVKSN